MSKTAHVLFLVFFLAVGCKGKTKEEAKEKNNKKTEKKTEKGVAESGKSPAPRGGRAGGAMAGLDKSRFPSGVSVTKTVRVDKATVDVLSKKLGGRIVSVVYHFVAMGEVKGRVNVMQAASEGDASAVVGTLVRKFKGRGRVSRKGAYVVEFVGMSPGVMHRFRQSMGLLDRSRRLYRFTARLGLVDSGNGGDTTDLFNLLLQPEVGDPRWSASVKRLKKAMKFGRTLRLRRHPTAAGFPKYSFEPAAESRKVSGASLTFAFGKVPRVHGIPAVRVTVRVPTAGFTDIRAGVKDRSALTRATKYWPTGHKAIRSLVSRLTAGKKTDLERLKRLHAWVFKSIRYGGWRTGSRDGTLNVLKRRHGRCWDKSDVLVTLARAAGLPARQVAGWAEEVGTGHIWSEVFVKGRGWVSVDATAPWIGVGGGYVPLMTTEDGEMSVLYVEMPKLARMK